MKRLFRQFSLQCPNKIFLRPPKVEPTLIVEPISIEEAQSLISKNDYVKEQKEATELARRKSMIDTNGTPEQSKKLRTKKSFGNELSIRQMRISQQVKDYIMDIIQNEPIPNPKLRIENWVISRVETNRDISKITVYWEVTNERLLESFHREIKNMLMNSTTAIRRRLQQRMNIERAPILEFMRENRPSTLTKLDQIKKSEESLLNVEDPLSEID